MKRSVAALGASAIVVCVAALPVGAAVLNDEAAAAPTVTGASSEVQAFDQGATYSDASLAGTGAVFLALGIATVSLAHRRRWRTIDLRDRNVDIREGAGKEARA